MFRSSNRQTNYSGWGLYLLWTILFISFMSSTSAIVYFGESVDRGFPMWLLLGRVAILLGIFLTCFGMLRRKLWGFYGFFAVMAALIPLSIVYTYYLEAETVGFDLTTGWIIQTTVVTSIIVMVIVTLVFQVLRNQVNNG